MLEKVALKIQRFLLMPTWFVFSPLLRMVHIDYHFPDVTFNADPAAFNKVEKWKKSRQYFCDRYVNECSSS